MEVLKTEMLKITKVKSNFGRFKINKSPVIDIISQFLNDFDFINFKYVCKRFYNLAYDSSKRQEKCFLIRKVKTNNNIML